MLLLCKQHMLEKYRGVLNKVLISPYLDIDLMKLSWLATMIFPSGVRSILRTAKSVMISFLIAPLLSVNCRLHPLLPLLSNQAMPSSVQANFIEVDVLTLNFDWTEARVRSDLSDISVTLEGVVDTVSISSQDWDCSVFDVYFFQVVVWLSSRGEICPNKSWIASVLYSPGTKTERGTVSNAGRRVLSLIWPLRSPSFSFSLWMLFARYCS